MGNNKNYKLPTGQFARKIKTGQQGSRPLAAWYGVHGRCGLGGHAVVWQGGYRDVGDGLEHSVTHGLAGIPGLGGGWGGSKYLRFSSFRSLFISSSCDTVTFAAAN